MGKGRLSLKNLLHRIKASSLLASVIWCLLGLVLLLWANLSARILCYILGGALLVHGISQAVPALRGGERQPRLLLEFVVGVAIALGGAWAILWPGASETLIPVILGAVTLIHGAEELGLALRMRKSGAAETRPALVLAAVTAVLGLFLILRPAFLGDALLRATGLCLLFDGVVRTWTFRAFARMEELTDELPSDSFEK